MLIVAQVLKRKNCWFVYDGFVNEATDNSARESGQDRKIPPALGTNQIAGFEGFRPKLET